MKLTFNWNAIQRIIDVTKAAKAVRPLHGDETGPGLWLAGDEGVYLLSNAALAEGEMPDVVYANECNPKTMPFDAWWSVKGKTFGGDDGIDFISLQEIERLGKIKPSVLTIDFSDGGMVIEAVARPARFTGPEV